MSAPDGPPTTPAADEPDPIGGDAPPAPPPAPVDRCPRCGTHVEQRAFCEECGADLGADPTGHAGSAPEAPWAPAAADPAGAAGRPPGESGAGMLVLADGPGALRRVEPPPEEPAGEPCADCGGAFVDGYCATCGAPAPDPDRHREDSPAPWVAGVCDIGVHHRGNQDAMALAAREDAPSAALVVCDGVSSALRSEEASQAAADAALAVLTSATSRGIAGPSSLVGALNARLDAAANAAADAVRRITHGAEDAGPDAPPAVPSAANPSCTFVAAAIDDGVVVVGSVGDSRAYWLPDDGPAQRLTTDDSWAEEEIRLGTPREVAERGPRAHTITRWIGVDAPDHTPAKAALHPPGPGWLLLCSDGLWNYASEPSALAAVVAEVTAAPAAEGAAGDGGDEGDCGDPNGSGPGAIDPVTLARGLVAWANAQGGHDNITVALARLDPDRRPPQDVAAGVPRAAGGDEDPLGQNPTIVIGAPVGAPPGPPGGPAPAAAPGGSGENATHG